MAYNGSGTFLINTAGQPVVAGTVISSTTFNALTADLATGLSTVITKDGQTTVTANIPMASFKFTGLGVGSAAGDSATLSQVQSTVTKLLASVSGTDTVTATASPTLAAYAAGQMFYFVAAGDNTTSVTLNIDALGAKAVTRDGSVALAAADIKSGEVVVVVYDGTRFQVVSQLNSAGNATFANVSITSALNVGGVATFSAGTAAAPSITTTGDTNTGLFFPAADTIAFTEGGTESLRITSAGDVGIGTASPASKLDVTGAFGTSTTALTVSNSSAASASNIARIDFRTSNTFGGNERVAAVWGMNPNASANNGGALVFGVSANGTATTPSEVARFDQAGNLGLGVTPSASSVKTFEIAAVGNTLSGFGNGDIALMSNVYYNSGFKYAGSNLATIYRQQDGVHKWFNAATGTAGNAISLTQAMTLDASGNLGIGTTTSRGNLDVSSGSLGGSQTRSIHLGYSASDFYGFRIANTNNVSSTYAGTFSIQRGIGSAFNDDFIINDSGNLLVGRTTASAVAPRLDVQAANFAMSINTTTGGANEAIRFFNNSTVVGSISTTGSTTAYNTSSDYRLKNAIAPMTGALAKVALLKPCTYKWNADGSDGQGFIAHELAEVVPQCVTGEKDAVDAEGKPQYQGVDASFLVATLTAAIQELTARVAQLESK